MYLKNTTHTTNELSFFALFQQAEMRNDARRHAQIFPFLINMRLPRHLAETPINRFGHYQLDLTQHLPPIEYDLPIPTKKRQEKLPGQATPTRRKKTVARQVRLFSAAEEFHISADESLM